MPSFDDLCRRGCMGDVVQLVGQIPNSLAMRRAVDLDDGSLEAALLWVLLAWRREFWTGCLGKLGVDVSQLMRELDALLGEERSASGSAVGMDVGSPSWTPESRRRLDRSLDALLGQAASEATSLGHNYLGNEHLLLAILAQIEGPPAELLSRHGLQYQTVKMALAGAPPRIVLAEAVVEPRFVVRSNRPWPATFDDRPATGVPRRFGMGALFSLITLYAVVFAVMQSFDTDPTVFVVLAVLLTGVGVGQTLLFDGKFPRAASICVGTVLLPIEVIAAVVYHHVSGVSSTIFASTPDGIVAQIVFSIPLGAFFGYLAGGLAGGVFVLLDLAAKRTRSDEEDEDGNDENDEDDEDDEQNQGS